MAVRLDAVRGAVYRDTDTQIHIFCFISYPALVRFILINETGDRDLAVDERLGLS